MSLGILGGMARGFEIKVPAGDQIRPTSVMLRRRLFDARQDLAGFVFIDLCAGSGAVGIEAWSRGADQVFLVEGHKGIYNYLKNNIQTLSKKYSQDFSDRPIDSYSKNFEKFLTDNIPSLLKNESETIIFFDPPYEKYKLYDFFFENLPLKELMEKKVQIWVESDHQKGPDFSKYELVKSHEIKRVDQGTQFVSILQF